MRNVLITVVALLLGSVLHSPALAGDFTDAQQKEIGQIVRDYLLAHPEVLQETSDALQKREQDRQASQAKQGIKANAEALLRSPLDFVAGNPDGKITVVEFFDYNCPYCKHAFPDVVTLIENNNDVRVVLKEFPILGEGSTFASKAAIAAKKQGKYLELHKAMFGVEGKVDAARVLSIAKSLGVDVEQLKRDMQAPDNDLPIKLDLDLANKLGINGTPTFIIGDQLSPGAVGLDVLKNQIASVRQNGCDVC